MLSAERIALLKHGAPPRNALEAALRNAWYGGSASYEKTVGPAPIISISDAKPKPAKSLIVGMEPIQDLHGYDNPWPAGGGVNILNPDYVVSNGTTNYGLSSSVDGDIISVSGTYTGTSATPQFRILKYKVEGVETEVDFSLKPFGVTATDAGYIILLGKADSNMTITIALKNLVTDTAYDIKFRIVGYTGTAPTAWTPYSNLCPITGRTGVTVERTGKNLFDFSSTIPYSSVPLDVSILSNGYRIIPAGSGNKTIRLRFGVLKAGQYSASVSIKDKDGQSPSGIYWMVDSGTGVSITNPISADGKTEYGFMFFGSNEKAPYDVTDIQLELGSTASDYSAYSGATYPVTWQTEAGTVYGCTVDIVSGLLTVTYAMVDLGTLRWYYIASRNIFEADLVNAKPFANTEGATALCSQYVTKTYGNVYNNDFDGSIAIAINSRVYVYDSAYTDVASFTQAMSGVQFCYELATPQTYQLTPTQIALLKGSNTLWSDADDLTLTYIGTTPPNLLGGMLGGGLVGAQEPIEETSEEPTEGEDE